MIAKRRCAVGVMLFLAATGDFAAQQPAQPAIRVQIDAVEIHAFVTDGQGNSVPNLTASDFEVLEDGRRQTITSFAEVELPIVRRSPDVAGPPAEPDLQRNSGEGRLYVIAFDNVAPLQALRTRAFLRRFIEEHFGDNDRAAVVSLGQSQASDAQDFTGSRRLLLQALDRFMGGSVDEPDVPSPALARPFGPDQDPPPAAPLLGRNLEAATRARLAMSAFRQLAESVAAIPGRRKAILFISTGLPVDAFSVIDNAGVLPAAGEEAREAFRAALRGNVAVYTIDPRGLTVEGGSGESTAAPTAGDRQSAREQRETLRALAEVTGGFALTDSNNFDAAFDRIVQESSAYYVLGFQSTNERRDGRYRRVGIRVNRPGVQVRARDGYLAQTNAGASAPRPQLIPGLSPAVGRALSSPIGVSALPMRTVTAAFKTDEPTAVVAVAVEIEPGAIRLASGNGLFTGQLEIAYVATAADGRAVPGDRHRVDLALQPDTYQQVQQHGIRVLLQPRLAPGRYQIRVAAGLADGAAGSVVTDVEIPDFAARALTIGGVVLGPDRADGTLTINAGTPLTLPFTDSIAARREFANGEVLTLYTELYGTSQLAGSQDVNVTVELRDHESRLVSTFEPRRLGTGANVGFTTTLPIENLPPGDYVVQVVAHATVGDRVTVSRAIPIRVR